MAYDLKLIQEELAECSVAKKTTYTGPWSDEPDRKEWVHNGYPCLMQRNHMLVWCGYVGIPNTHPLYGINYNYLDMIEVHGGLTYAEPCQGIICHASDDARWWLGFDCCHGYDAIPMRHYGLPRHFDGMFERIFAGTYKNEEYVTQQVIHLADQLKSFEGKTWEEINAKQQ